MLAALWVMLDHAPNWKVYCLSTVGAFMLLFVLLAPAVAILEGATIRESLIIPLAAIWIGVPFLLTACIMMYPLFRFIYNKSGLSHGSRVFLSGGLTVVVFVLLITICLSIEEGLVWTIRHVSLYALATGAVSCIFYWLSTRNDP